MRACVSQCVSGVKLWSLWGSWVSWSVTAMHANAKCDSWDTVFITEMYVFFKLCSGVRYWKDGDEDDQLEFSWKKNSLERRRRLCVEAVGDVMRRGRLRWHGYVERKDDADYAKACTRLVVVAGRPRNTWQNTLSADMHSGVSRVGIGGFPKVTNLRGWWRSVPVRVSLG